MSATQREDKTNLRMCFLRDDNCIDKSINLILAWIKDGPKGDVDYLIKLLYEI